MRVAELFAAAPPVLDTHTCFELLRQAELRGVTDARTFLLELRSWGVCGQWAVWRLRKVYNEYVQDHRDKLWVPLTA